MGSIFDAMTRPSLSLAISIDSVPKQPLLEMRTDGFESCSSKLSIRMPHVGEIFSVVEHAWTFGIMVSMTPAVAADKYL